MLKMHKVLKLLKLLKMHKMLVGKAHANDSPILFTGCAFAQFES